MAYAKLNPMYEYVKGAASKPKKVDGHNHGTYTILQHRETPTTNPNCQRGDTTVLIQSKTIESYDASKRL